METIPLQNANNRAVEILEGKFKGRRGILSNVYHYKNADPLSRCFFNLRAIDDKESLADFDDPGVKCGLLDDEKSILLVGTANLGGVVMNIIPQIIVKDRLPFSMKTINRNSGMQAGIIFDENVITIKSYYSDEVGVWCLSFLVDGLHRGMMEAYKVIKDLRPENFGDCIIRFFTPVTEQKLIFLDSIFGILSVLLFQGIKCKQRSVRYVKDAKQFDYMIPIPALLLHPVITHLCSDIARAAIAMSASLPREIIKISDEEIHNIINTRDEKMAKKFMQQHSVLYNLLIKRRYVPEKVNPVFKLIERGAVNCLDLSNIFKNWYVSEDDNLIWQDHSESPNCSVYKMILKED